MQLSGTPVRQIMHQRALHPAWLHASALEPSKGKNLPVARKARAQGPTDSVGRVYQRNLQPPHCDIEAAIHGTSDLTLSIEHCANKLRAFGPNVQNVHYLQDSTEEAEETSSSGRSDEESLAAHAGNADMPFTVRNAVMLSSIPGFCECCKAAVAVLACTASQCAMPDCCEHLKRAVPHAHA